MAGQGEYEVSVGAHRFDPRERASEPGAADAGLAADADAGRPGWFLVQVHAPLQAPDAARLRAQYGLLLRDYVPNLAYAERLEPGARAALAADPLVRAVAPYEPAFKLDPTIGQVPARTEDRRAASRTPFQAILFDQADPDPVRDRLAAVGAEDVVVADDRPIGGSVRVRFSLADARGVEQVARVQGVQWIEEVPEVIPDNVGAAGTIQSGDPSSRVIWDKGLHGEGQVIGMLDNGPPDLGHAFFRDAADNAPRPAHRKVVAVRNVAAQPADDHATFVAGCAAGDDVGGSGAHAARGGAWAARLVCGTYHDLTGTRTLLRELTDAAAAGAHIHTNSWHDDTAGNGNPATYNQNAADVDAFTFANEDHLVLGSAGNTGEEQGPPGTAKNAICVACAKADPDEMELGDGNPGPTSDGRRKPDLCTVGCGITSAVVGTADGTRADVCATSWATPHAAAAAALVRQYMTDGWYPDGVRVEGFGVTPSGALLKAMLIASAVDMTGVTGFPSDDEGWGLVRLQNVLVFPGSPVTLTTWDRRHARGLTTGEMKEHEFFVPAGTSQLKVVLVWTDPPGTVAAASSVVNDLDLTLVSPDRAQSFLGNQLSGGVSVAGGSADPLNPVEVAVIASPAAGAWKLQVSARSVSVGSPGQGYALVATSTSASGGGPCFVASAVYGDPAHPDVALLRGWRDAHLRPGARGRRAMRALVAVYGRVGPPLAAAVGPRPRLAAAVRRGLVAPVVTALRARRAPRGAGGRRD